MKSKFHLLIFICPLCLWIESGKANIKNVSEILFQNDSATPLFAGTWEVLQTIPADPSVMERIKKQSDKSLMEGKLTKKEYDQVIKANTEITGSERISHITLKTKVASDRLFTIEQTFEPVKNCGGVSRKFFYHAQGDGIVFKVNETISQIIMANDPEQTLNTIVPAFISNLLSHQFGKSKIDEFKNQVNIKNEAILLGDSNGLQLKIETQHSHEIIDLKLLNRKKTFMAISVEEMVPKTGILKKFKIQHFSNDGNRLMRSEEWELVSYNLNAALSDSIGKFKLLPNYILNDKINHISLMTNDLLNKKTD